MLCLALLLGACSREDEVPLEENEVEQPEDPTQNRPSRSICNFDLTPKEGNYSLTGDWEFIGFENLETGALGDTDQTTCNARTLIMPYMRLKLVRKVFLKFFSPFLKIPMRVRVKVAKTDHNWRRWVLKQR